MLLLSLLLCCYLPLIPYANELSLYNRMPKLQLVLYVFGVFCWVLELVVIILFHLLLCLSIPLLFLEELISDLSLPYRVSVWFSHFYLYVHIYKYAHVVCIHNILVCILNILKTVLFYAMHILDYNNFVTTFNDYIGIGYLIAAAVTSIVSGAFAIQYPNTPFPNYVGNPNVAGGSGM